MLFHMIFIFKSKVVLIFFQNAPLNYTVFKGVSVKDDDSGVNAEVSLSCFQSNAEVIKLTNLILIDI